jgi:hypothetical protein
VSLATFARLGGQGLRVRAGGGVVPAAGAEMPEGLGVSELVAEAALLQARLDWFQSRLAHPCERGAGQG